MGGGFIGGDGSVRWELFGDNIDTNHDSVPVGSHGRKHTAIDKTSPGGLFTIVFDKEASGGGGGSQDYTFTLPIRPNKHKQIQILWQSAAATARVTARQKLIRRPTSPVLLNPTREIARVRKKAKDKAKKGRGKRR